MGAWIYAISSGGAVTTYRRVCGLCGRSFAIYLPPGDQEKLVDVQLTAYAARDWRANFFPVGIAHSIVGGSA
jgi:hypothetical protein